MLALKDDSVDDRDRCGQAPLVEKFGEPMHHQRFAHKAAPFRDCVDEARPADLREKLR